jgi:hypothetical protein
VRKGLPVRTGHGSGQARSAERQGHAYQADDPVEGREAVRDKLCLHLANNIHGQGSRRDRQLTMALLEGTSDGEGDFYPGRCPPTGTASAGERHRRQGPPEACRGGGSAGGT